MTKVTLKRDRYVKPLRTPDGRLYGFICLECENSWRINQQEIHEEDCKVPGLELEAEVQK